MWWHCAALVLVYSPIEIPVPQQAPPPLFEALIDVAVAADLWDRTQWRLHEFPTEVRWTRHAIHNLRDQPGSADIHRWPPNMDCQRAIELNWAYQRHLEGLQQIYPEHWFELETALCETRACCEPWLYLSYAWGGPHPFARRDRLQQLRRVLGPEDYHAGRLPPPVPLWRFRVIE